MIIQSNAIEAIMQTVGQWGTNDSPLAVLKINSADENSEIIIKLSMVVLYFSAKNMYFI